MDREINVNLVLHIAVILGVLVELDTGHGWDDSGLVPLPPALCTGGNTTAGEGRPTDTRRTTSTAARCETGPSSPDIKTKLSNYHSILVVTSLIG